jgi:hypothetical protein
MIGMQEAMVTVLLSTLWWHGLFSYTAIVRGFHEGVTYIVQMTRSEVSYEKSGLARAGSRVVL